MSGIFAKYHVQIMLLFVYTTTHKRFVIFTCRYFKSSWNTTALSQSNCSNFSCSSINLELTDWITHIKAHSLQSLMHTYFLWKRPKATQFDLGFFITLDRPYRHSISVSKIVLFWHLRFYVQYLRSLSWEEAVTYKVKAYNTSACKNSHAYTSVTHVTAISFGTQLPALPYMHLLTFLPVLWSRS